MKRWIALVIAASTVGLAGCCTTPRAAKWEYKVEDARQWVPRDSVTPDWLVISERHLNDLGKDGWVLIQRDGSVYYFKRAAK